MAINSAASRPKTGSGNSDCLTEFGGGDVDGGARRTAPDAGDGQHTQLVGGERPQAAHRQLRAQNVRRLAPLGLLALAGTAAERRLRRVLGAELYDVGRDGLDVARVPAETDRV